MQVIFNPINFHFEWVDGWYKWDRASAHKSAMSARNAEAARLKKLGYKVSKFSLPNQLVRRGGIGSGNPDVEFVVNCYGLNAKKEVPQ